MTGTCPSWDDRRVPLKNGAIVALKRRACEYYPQADYSFSGKVSAKNNAPFSRLTNTGIGRPAGNAFTNSVN